MVGRLFSASHVSWDYSSLSLSGCIWIGVMSPRCHPLLLKLVRKSFQRVLDYQNHYHDLYCLRDVEGESVTWTAAVLVCPFSPGWVHMSPLKTCQRDLKRLSMCDCSEERRGWVEQAKVRLSWLNLYFIWPSEVWWVEPEWFSKGWFLKSFDCPTDTLMISSLLQ